MNQDWRNFPMLCGEDLDKLPLLEMGAFRPIHTAIKYAGIRYSTESSASARSGNS